MEKLVKHTKTAAEGRMPFGGGLLLLSEAERYAHIRAPIIFGCCTDILCVSAAIPYFLYIA